MTDRHPNLDVYIHTAALTFRNCAKEVDFIESLQPLVQNGRTHRARIQNLN